MRILVAYASRHGATTGIAERIAETMARRGLDVTLSRVDEVRDVDRYDAFVIGSAAYTGHWLKDATRFVQQHRPLLASRPVWLFSSGPIGAEPVDAKGRDVLDVAEPHEFAEFQATLHPRGLRVFFGAYDPDAKPIGVLEHVGAWFIRMPSIREAMPAGDFRDWRTIEAWAEDISQELRQVGRPTAVSA
jgi:menaquinone-dependent protoporphyrinogen oxidase